LDWKLRCVSIVFSRCDEHDTFYRVRKRD
jgi:hypothetical protein